MSVVIDIYPHMRSDGTKHPNAFDVYLGKDMILTSDTPFFSAARWLLERDFCKGDTLTMRCRGIVSLRAMLGAAAGYIISETGSGPKRRKYDYGGR